MYEQLGEAIARARNRADLTQPELAERIGKSHQTVSAYERGTVDIPFSVLVSIAEATDTRLYELLGYSEHPVIEELSHDDRWTVAYLLIPRELIGERQ